MSLLVVLLDEASAKTRVRRLDPMLTFQISGKTLELSPSEPPAVYSSGRWRSPGGEFHLISVESRVAVHFEDSARHSKAYGPFEGLRIVDGAIRPLNAPQQVLAWMDQDQPLWHIHGDPVRWLKVVFTAAGD